MFYAEVIFLRGREGQRLRRSDWSAPIFGEVVIEDSTATKGAFRRLMRRAVLTQTVGVSSLRTAAVIFDPYFLPSAEGAMLIAGVQLQHCIATKTNSEHGQVWLCRTRAVPDRPLPPVSAALERLRPRFERRQKAAPHGLFDTPTTVLRHPAWYSDTAPEETTLPLRVGD